MAEGKSTFNLYCDMIGVFEKLTDEKAGQLIKHIFRYVNDQNPETDDLILDLCFEPIKAKLKLDLKRWEAKCLKNAENIKKRWIPNDTTVLNGIPENTTVSIRIPLDTKNTDKDKDKDKDKDTSVKRVFVKPTLEEIKLFISQENLLPDPERFFDHYQSNGWRIGGKSPMKDWKATVRNWHRTELEKTKNSKPKFETAMERTNRILQEEQEKTERMRYASKLREFPPRQSFDIQESDFKTFLEPEPSDIGQFFRAEN